MHARSIPPSPWRLSLALTAALLGVAGTASAQGPRADFNGDGKTDILWRNSNSRRLSAWFMDGTQRIGASLFPASPPDAGWNVYGTGDFNGDGKTDLVWRNSNSGRVSIWFMDGINFVQGVPVNPPQLTELDPRWILVGTGDLNGDGQLDLLWRNEVLGDILQGYIRVWLMNGATVLAEVSTEPDELTDLHWHIAGTGDFNGDAKVDLLWRNEVSNVLVVWLMNGLDKVSGQPIVLGVADGFPNQQWTVAGLWDLNGDGSTDILWHNQVSGKLMVWFMNGLTVIGIDETTPNQVPDTTWRIVGPR